jgi:hypothetical protein
LHKLPRLTRGATRARQGICATIVVSLVVLALSGCGSSHEQTVKQARIAAALRKLEHELTADAQTPPPGFGGKDVLGSLNLIYAPAPNGISNAEWETAIHHDKRLQRLKAKLNAPPSSRTPPSR